MTLDVEALRRQFEPRVEAFTASVRAEVEEILAHAEGSFDVPSELLDTAPIRAGSHTARPFVVHVVIAPPEA